MISILFSGNKEVFDGVLTTTLSLLMRKDNDEPIHIYVLTMDATHIKEIYVPITEKKIAILNEVIKSFDERNVATRIDVTDLYEEYFVGSPNEDAYCSPYTLIRLFADLIPNLPDKILYLDIDVMFNHPINLIYDIDISEYEYAASRDHYGKYLLNPNYINAGVLLLNLRKIRETGLFVKARKLLQQKKLVFADQSALIRSTTKRLVLPQKYNDQKFLHKSTVIRHFSKRLFYLPYPHTDNIKQWQIEKVHKIFKYHAFDDIYQKYLEIKENYNI